MMYTIVFIFHIIYIELIDTYESLYHSVCLKRIPLYRTQRHSPPLFPMKTLCILI